MVTQKNGSHETASPRPLRTILYAGLLAGALDITAACVQAAALRGLSPVAVLHSVASGLLGAQSFQGGLTTAILGGLLHFFIATVAAAVYYAASRRLKVMVQRPVLSGLIYGIAVYLFMYRIVVPLSAAPFKMSFRPSAVISSLIIHMLCVGLPISLVIRRHSHS